MKKVKLLSSLALVLVMAFSFAACQSDSSSSSTPSSSVPSSSVSSEAGDSSVVDPPSTNPMDRITEGYYCYKFTAEGHGDFAFFFNFYEEDPVLGAVFYAGLSNNRTNFAGTYTVEEAEYAYAVYYDRETEQADEDPTEGVAPYTVTFFDWDGNEIGQCGFDGDVLYNEMGKPKDGKIYSTGSAPFAYPRDESGEFASVTEGEMGVPFASFVADDEPTSTLEIYHNFTYADLVDAMVEGSWTVSKNAEGGLEFVLTPDDSSDTGAVVSTSADRTTCTYTPDGGEPIAMTDPNAGAAAVAYFFEGAFRIEAYGVDAALLLNLYEDGTCVLTAAVAGNESTLDTGTYTLDGHTFSFEFEKGENTESSVDGSGTVTVEINVTDEKLGEIATELTLNRA